MTQRECEAVARVLAELVHDPALLMRLVDAFKAYNPRFKWRRAILRHQLEFSSGAST
jgi:hypothetical protein